MNEHTWICNELGISNISDIDSVLNFTIFWNLFENRYFKSMYRPSEIVNVYFANCNSSEVNEETKKMLKIFQKRYIIHNNFTYYFTTLNLRSNDNKLLIKEVLLGNVTTEESIFQTVITIIGRFRNNLFHGLKQNSEIINQKEIFSVINEYLSKLIKL